MFPLRGVSLSYHAAAAWQLFLSEVRNLTCSNLNLRLSHCCNTQQWSPLMVQSEPQDSVLLLFTFLMEGESHGELYWYTQSHCCLYIHFCFSVLYIYIILLLYKL